jgi:formylglycine-generating enzyme required for sulfatase activity
LGKLCERLRGLDLLLRREHIRRGADTWQAVYDLLLRLDSQGRLPEDPAQWAPLLGPLLCRKPEEQRNFPRWFQEWLEGESQPPPPAVISAPAQAQLARGRWRVAGLERRWRLAILGLAVLALAAAAWLYTVHPTDAPHAPAPPPQTLSKPISPPQPGPTGSTQRLPLITQAPPRRQPMLFELPAAWRFWLDAIGYGLVGIQPLLALLWLLRHYQRRQRLRWQKQPGERDTAFRGLHFKLPQAQMFGEGHTRAALTALRPALWRPTRRIDVDATVAASTRKAGYIQPCYRSKRREPVYLLLVRQLDRDDHRAALAEELARRCAELGIATRCYHFRDDPRWLRPWDSKTGKVGASLSLAQLAVEYGDAGLLLFSEAAILFHPLSGQPRLWLDEFKPWPRRVWLHERDAGLAHAELLWRHQFLALPLESAQLPVLAAWLRSGGALPTQPTAQRVALPEAISDEPDAWLSPYPPYGADLAQLHWELHWYLGTRGLLLLQTLMVYPEPHWPLTQALDYLLFAELERDQPERREHRLARLGRLPWLRHAYFPDYLREDLLRRAAPEDLETLRAAWGRLFGQLNEQAGPRRLSLQMAPPKRRSLRRWLADWRASGQAGALNDPLFAHILLGGRLGLWDFRIPQAIARKLPGGRRLADARPVFAALLLAAGGVYATLWAWQHSGQDRLRQLWEQRLRQENACCPAHLHGGPETRLLAQALRASLPELGFQLAPEAPNSPSLCRADAASPPQNCIAYPPQAQAAAERLAEQLRQLSYGASVKMQAVAGVQGLNLELAQSYAARSAFNDALVYPVPKSFRDKLQQGGLGPEMVVIPAGEFRMGSPKDEPKRDSDEGPQHSVKLAQSFALARYELSFAEYDAYVDSLSSGKTQAAASCAKREVKKPEDRGWGRGQRPVINVGWEEAQCYAAWLSEQTGQAYRLPTEAEWEYAARAGTRTPFSTGDCIHTDQANYDGNYDYQDCGAKTGVYLRKTQTVGSYPPNPWGLHDMHGNVWEWTADCRHQTYQNAPPDGRAWGAEDGGACDLRGVRGGSWLSIPQLLRSADRIRSWPDGASNALGFRLARAL